eukprot:318986-Prymnesium_polylepis.1
MDAMDDGLFSSFEDTGPAAKRSKLAAGPSTMDAAHPAGAAGSPFAHMSNELVASVVYNERLDAESRLRLENAFRQSTVLPLPAGASPHSEPATTPPVDGAVHYYQAFSVDVVGATTAAAAMAAPVPAYDRLIEAPLPHPVDGAPASRPRQQGRRPQGFQGRYFDAPVASSARPGTLSAELRAQLGIGPNDPPPFLARMQALGYPPGYMGDPDAPTEQADDLQFFDGPARTLNNADGERTAPRLVPLVDFPGLNVPPPAGADPRAWGWRGPVMPRPAA